MRSQAFDDGKTLARCVPPASDGDKVLARCVLECLAVARFRRGAFPGGNPWQFFHSMYPKRGLGRENRQFAARFARHASENGLALAGYARHASEMPRKSPSEDTPCEDLARKGRFSLRGPLESCTARESCHPASTKRPSARNPSAAEQREPPTNTPPLSWQRATHSIRGASGSHTANAPTPHRPATLRRQADVKPCASRAPQRQSATRGQPRRKRSRTPHQRQHPALQWRASARCRSKAQRGSLAANPGGRPPLAAPAAPNRPRTPRANQQQPSAGLRFVPSKARTHHTYLSAAPVAGSSS